MKRIASGVALALAIVAVATCVQAATLPAELVAAAKTLADAKTFRVTLPQMRADVIRPDRVRVHVAADEPYDVIVVGQHVWMKTPNAAWKPLNARAAQIFGSIGKAGLPPGATAQGPANGFDGTGAAHVYVVTGLGPDPPLQWFVRLSDGKVHRIAGPGKPPGSIENMDFDDYDAAVTIEEPAPYP